MNKLTKAAPRRTCQRCGQPINTQTDSWEMKQSEDEKYATGIQHVTCPASPEMQNLPPAPSIIPPELLEVGQALVFLTMDEAAALIHVSKQTIRRYIRKGELPAKRLRGGQTVLIEQAHVLALLEDITPILNK